MFKFTIRDLLWLTLVVGMGVGWGLDRGTLATALTDCRQEMQIEGEWYQSQLNQFMGHINLLRKMLEEQAEAKTLPSE
jgi:hypothetical protein